MTGNTTTELAAVQAAAVAEKPLSIKDAVLAQFKDAEVTINGLVEKYRDVAYDVTTPKGMKEAVAARADLRDNGRLFVTRAETRVKAEVNDLKRVMSAEVDRLVALVKPHEDAIDAQIKAEEKRKDDEKQERARVEAERVAKHRQGLDKIATYPSLLEGRTLAAMEEAITKVEAITIGESWEEFADEARQALAKALNGMRDVAARERMRLENERMAALLKEQAEALERTQAELMRQRVAATVFTFPDPEPPTHHPNGAPMYSTTVFKENGEPIMLDQHGNRSVFCDLCDDESETTEITEVQQPKQVLKAEPAMADATDLGHAANVSPRVGAMGAGQAADAAPTGEDTSPVITTGVLCDRLGLPLRAEFIQSLGFEPVPCPGRGTYWKESDIKPIGLALIKHIESRIA